MINGLLNEKIGHLLIHILLYSSAFFMYGEIYICAMQGVLYCDYHKVFHKDLTNTTVNFDIKLVFIEAVIIPIIVMTVLIGIYSYRFIHKHKIKDKPSFIYGIINYIISVFLKSFGILSIILGLLEMTKENPNMSVNLLSPITIIVSIFMVGYTALAISHERAAYYKNK